MERNILIIGNPGTGKASIAQAIVNSEIFPIGAPLESKKQQNDVCFKEHHGTTFNCKIALVNTHTMGHSDASSKVQERVTIALDYLKRVNLVLLVVKLEPFTDKIREMLEEVISCLGRNAEDITSIVVTWCELVSKDAEATIAENLRNRARRVTQFAQNRIYPIGLPPQKYIHQDLQSVICKRKRDSEKNIQLLLSQAEEQVLFDSDPKSNASPRFDDDFTQIRLEDANMHPLASQSTVPPGRPPYQPQQSLSKQRNIMIFGKAGAGKSTVANAILGANVFSVGTSIQSSTRQVRQADNINVQQVSINGFIYKIATIDTVSVTDSSVSRFPLQQRTNNGIRMLQSANLILLVFKLERFTKQEQQSFREVISLLHNTNSMASAITALVVTCCEQKTREDRQKIKKELEQTVSYLTSFAGMGVHLVGLPQISQVHQVLKEYVHQEMKKDEGILQMLTAQAQQSVALQPVQ